MIPALFRFDVTVAACEMSSVEPSTERIRCEGRLLEVQDIGGYLLYLVGSAVLVGLLRCGLVGLSRGWLHVPHFAQAMVQTPARIVQAVTLFALIAAAGPAWVAVQETEQSARQLATWHEFSDRVMLSFEMGEEHLDVVAERVQQVVSTAEAEGRVVMSYTIKETDWSADFGPYSAVSIVNSGWIDLVSGSAGEDALVPVSLEQRYSD